MDVSRVNLIAKMTALDLWEFGEDDYIDKALRLSDDELKMLGEKVYTCFNEQFYEKIGRSVPASGYDIGFVTALVLVEYFEGGLRPLKRDRRRNHSELPGYLVITEKDYSI